MEANYPCAIKNQCRASNTMKLSTNGSRGSLELDQRELRRLEQTDLRSEAQLLPSHCVVQTDLRYQIKLVSSWDILRCAGYQWWRLKNNRWKYLKFPPATPSHHNTTVKLTIKYLSPQITSWSFNKPHQWQDRCLLYNYKYFMLSILFLFLLDLFNHQMWLEEILFWTNLANL